MLNGGIHDPEPYAARQISTSTNLMTLLASRPSACAFAARPRRGELYNTDNVLLPNQFVAFVRLTVKWVARVKETIIDGKQGQ